MMTFKCIKCSEPTRVLETRKDRRRRICLNGHRFTTKQVGTEEMVFVSNRNVPEPEPVKKRKIFSLSALWGR
jgi:transcriptional regulator NrdR family protein